MRMPNYMEILLKVSGGDDLYCNSGCFVTLNANNSDCLLLECKHFVDGWYWDEAGAVMTVGIVLI